MKVDLPQPDTWYSTNDRMRDALGIKDDPAVSVQSYLGIRHALWEITQALAHTYPHRRTIGYTPFTGPEGELVALQFAKEGFTVKALTIEEFKEPKLWIEAASKQMLCLISAFDDPATGELFQIESHTLPLKDQRIFRVLISHSYHENFLLKTPGPYEVHLVSLASDLTVAILGERAKLVPPIASSIDWLKFQKLSLPNAKPEQKRIELESALTQFKKLPPKSSSVFASEFSLLPDRCLLTYEDVEGTSLIDKISKNLSRVVNPEQLDTLSLCKWQDPRALEWLMQKGFSPTKLRGTIVVSSELILEVGAEKLRSAIEISHQQLQQEQAG